MNMFRVNETRRTTEFTLVPAGDPRLLNQMTSDGFRFNKATGPNPVPEFKGDWIFLEVDCDDGEIHNAWWTWDAVNWHYSLGEDYVTVWPVYLADHEGRWSISFYGHDGVKFFHRPAEFSTVLAIPRNKNQEGCYEAMVRPDTHVCEGDTPFQCTQCHHTYCAGVGAADKDFDLCDNCVAANE